jgi:hypothetical protein
MRRLSAVLFGLLLATASHAAVATFDFYDRGPYHPGVPKPAEVLGYAPGTFHTTWGNMERYLDALAHARPDRVRREAIGKSVEARERTLFIVSSPENLAKLDAIREANRRIADPRGVDAATIEKLVRETPVTVWLNYSIHGDESASFEAMMQVAYQLVAGDGADTQSMLDHALILINPAHNPDGHERFVTWINANGQGDPERWALEQQRAQPWGIYGRYTHYKFDPNRDALAMSHPESQQSSLAIRRWRPQVFVDHHGQTPSFFFPPTADPTNWTLPRADYKRWVETFGRANAAAFDRYGWQYLVRDVFDFHAAGYWDVWPTMQGAIGMTYETDGGGNLALRRDDGTVVTMLDGMKRHFVASLTTIETAVKNREQRLRDAAAFARASCTPADDARAYVLDAGADPVRAAALAENLMHAGVEVRWVKEAFSAKAARPTWDDPGSREAPKDGKGLNRTGSPYAPLPAGARTFAHGAFVVNLAQPGSRSARALIEFDRSVDTAFARRELEKYERNIRRGRHTPTESYGFYDITSWCLPASYGVHAYAVRELPPAGVLLAEPDPNRPDEATEMLPDSAATGLPFTARISRAGPLVLRDAAGAVALDLRGRVEGGEATSAYVWTCASDGAARLALRLMQEDFRVATATKPMSAGGRAWPRGSFIVRVERNPATLHARIAALARDCGVTVRALNSAYPDEGDTGIGSYSVISLKRPRIAIAVDGSGSQDAYGWAWFLFERRLGVRFTAVPAGRLAGVLDKYNVVILPDGNANGLVGDLGDVGAFKDWVRRGGTLVCLDDASEFPTLKSVGLSSAKVVGVKVKKDEKDEKDDDAPADSARSEAERRPEYIPGTTFWATLDPRHWLAWGFQEPRIPVMLQGNTMLTRSRDGANALTFDRTPLTVTGWTWPETERRLANGAFAIDEPSGDGHVVMLGGPVLFRMFWRNTERLLTNAVMYGPALP